MNEDKIVGYIYETTDYAKFKKMEGNRGLENRPEKIKESIEENGYVFNPILCNEFFEVGDGQGRLDALSDLGLPVHYIISEGIGLKECIVLNAKSTSWSMHDFVNAYVKKGNENYIRLKALADNHFLTETTILRIAKMYYGSGVSHGKAGSNTIKNGEVVLSEEEFNEANKILTFTDSLKPTLDSIGGKYNEWCYALAFCYRHRKIDTERLASKISRLQTEIPPCSKTIHCLAALEKIYNYNSRGGRKVHLVADYEDMCTAKNAGYSRWKNKRKEINL